MYADFFDKDDEPIWSIALYSRTSKGPSVGEFVGTSHLININIIFINKINR